MCKLCVVIISPVDFLPYNENGRPDNEPDVFAVSKFNTAKARLAKQSTEYLYRGLTMSSNIRVSKELPNIVK